MMGRMAEGYWLAKSEPFKYPWEKLVQDKRTTWDGIRSFEARNNLRAMQKGDLVLFYHSNEGKEIVGVAKVVKTAYPDQSADEGDWSAVDIAPLKALKAKVSLATIKSDKKLSGMALVRRSRLSVVPVTPGEFARILELAETKL
jgi:predicted RNA-binding protein with PUA-like domain